MYVVYLWTASLTETALRYCFYSIPPFLAMCLPHPNVPFITSFPILSVPLRILTYFPYPVHPFQTHSSNIFPLPPFTILCAFSSFPCTHTHPCLEPPLPYLCTLLPLVLSKIHISSTHSSLKQNPSWTAKSTVEMHISELFRLTKYSYFYTFIFFLFKQPCRTQHSQIDDNTCSVTVVDCRRDTAMSSPHPQLFGKWKSFDS